MNGKDFTIPPFSHVIPNINAVHTYLRYWASDPLTWDPKRWILSSTSVSADSVPTNSTVAFNRETLRTSPKGAYVPWSDGARGCPGKKFGQVEFVAAMCALFREHRVAPVLEEDETVGMARERTLKGM